MKQFHSKQGLEKMQVIILTIISLSISVMGFQSPAHAQLNAPTLMSYVDNLNITVSWNFVDGATGYTFYAAPYPDAETIYEIDMGNSASFTAELWDGAAFYIAVKSHNDSEVSAISNVESFTIVESDDSVTSSTSDATRISLQGTQISISGSGAAVENSTVTISSSGSYQLEGTLSDGQIIVDTEDEDDVTLIFNGIDINSSTSAPLFIKSSEKTIIHLTENTTNTITDASSYVFDDPDEDEPDAALFSKDDLVIEGSGTLTINANYNDALKSKDGLDITNGTIQITSVDDGIIGKDYINIENGSFTINAQGDGLKSTNDEDEDKGFVTIANGLFNITSGADAVQAETDITIEDGNFIFMTGGGSSAALAEDDSAKGLKGTVTVTISGGTFSIDAADDAVHSNGDIVVDGGALTLATGDDGFHADADLTINSGTIDITKSFEGLEGATISINGGEIHTVSSDDGINVAGGTDDDSATMFGMGGPDSGFPGGNDNFPGGNDNFPGGNDNFVDSGDYHLYINDGTIVIDADGDGLDSNGTIEMNGGTVIINGPTNNGNGALDYDGSFAMNGGTLIAAGSSGMAQAPGNTSTQNAVLVNFRSSLSAGTLINIQDNYGNDLLTFAPSKTYQSIVFSSSDLITDATYGIYTGGSATGTVSDGVYRDGSYSPGTEYTQFTISNTITTIR